MFDERAVLSIICILFTHHFNLSYSDFSFANDKIMQNFKDDVLAGFGDFDADKLIDVFVINNKGGSPQINQHDINYLYFIFLNNTCLAQSMS